MNHTSRWAIGAWLDSGEPFRQRFIRRDSLSPKGQDVDRERAINTRRRQRSRAMARLAGAVA